MRDMLIAWFVTLPAAALVGFVIFKLTVLPGALAWIATVAAIAVLLGWAGRLMANAMTAEDIAAELPTDEQRRSESYGIQVAQPDEPRV